MKTCTLFLMINIYFLKIFLDIYFIYLKVNIPREYIKLSPISRTIIPHRTPDGHLAKTGYVKLSAFSQVVKTAFNLNLSYQKSECWIISYVSHLKFTSFLFHLTDCSCWYGKYNSWTRKWRSTLVHTRFAEQSSNS